MLTLSERQRGFAGVFGGRETPNLRLSSACLNPPTSPPFSHSGAARCTPRGTSLTNHPPPQPPNSQPSQPPNFQTPHLPFPTPPTGSVDALEFGSEVRSLEKRKPALQTAPFPGWAIREFWIGMQAGNRRIGPRTV